MIYPKFINKNDTIGVICPSAGAATFEKQNKFNNATEFFKKNNYNLIVSKNVFSSYMGRSANKELRAKEINEMYANNDIDLVLCATGGEFQMETLPFINFELIKQNPKFVCGFSDPTALLYPITTNLDIATIYGQNFSPFGMERLHQSQKDFLKIINGEVLKEKSYSKYEAEYTPKSTGLEYYNLTKNVKWKTLDNKEINITGRIIGGCLDVIDNLSGTKYDGTKRFIEKYKDDGIIWYFDNCDLSMESFIRSIWRLKELDYFKYAKLIIFGRFGNEQTVLNYDVKTAIEDSSIGSLNIPIIYDADISHKAPCLTLINGSIANVKCARGKGEISFELK